MHLIYSRFTSAKILHLLQLITTIIMKTLKLLFAITLTTFITISCKNEVKTETTDVESSEIKNENTAIAKAEFTIEGMTCAMGCAKRIESKLAEMEGVTSAKVDFENKLAMVEFEEGNITTSDLEETVKDAGSSYSVVEMKTVESFTQNEAKNNVKEGHNCSKTCLKTGCPSKDKASCKKDCKMPCCAKKI